MFSDSFIRIDRRVDDVLVTTEGELYTDPAPNMLTPAAKACRPSRITLHEKEDELAALEKRYDEQCLPKVYY